MDLLTRVAGPWAGALFAASVPLVLVLTNLRLMVLDPGVYERGFAQYAVAETTGMTPNELRQAAAQLIRYFREGEPISLRVRKGDALASLFNERELIHLADVRSLFELAFGVQRAASLYALVFLAVTLAWRRPRPWGALAKPLLAGSLITLGLFAVAYLVIAANFEEMFLRFHLLSFRNEYWRLDPRTDYLIRMFPQGFWYDAAGQLAGRSALAAALLGALSGGFLHWRRREGNLTKF